MINECPYCKKIIDCSTGISDDAIKPDIGDISICFTCSGISTYKTVSNEGNTFEKVTEEILHDMFNEYSLEFYQVVKAVFGIRKEPIGDYNFETLLNPPKIIPINP